MVLDGLVAITTARVWTSSGWGGHFMVLPWMAALGRSRGRRLENLDFMVWLLHVLFFILVWIEALGHDVLYINYHGEFLI